MIEQHVGKRMQVDSESIGGKFLAAETKQQSIFELFDRAFHIGMRAVLLLVEVAGIACGNVGYNVSAIESIVCIVAATNDASIRLPSTSLVGNLAVDADAAMLPIGDSIFPLVFFHSPYGGMYFLSFAFAVCSSENGFAEFALEFLLGLAEVLSGQGSDGMVAGDADGVVDVVILQPFE